MTETVSSNTYDDLPYYCSPYPQSHPRVLATMATLFGMEPADIHKASILELGCGDGSNLIPMATQLPEATLVGVEQAARQIKSGKQIVEELKLRNITLHKKDILEIDHAFGTFDYIIAQGVYSWVPYDVREKTLSICKQNLRPNGVAFVSYNTYPGWRMREMPREIMMYHTAQFPEPRTKVQQARDLIQFLVESVPTENNPYGLCLKQEWENMRQWKDSHIFHDSLERVNEPVYFHKFMECATRQGLQYLGEADFATMFVSNFDARIQETLQRLGKTIIEMEQYMDFVRNRMFRQTLLCHEGFKLQRKLVPEKLFEFYFTSSLKPASEITDFRSEEPLEFQGTNGTITSSQPLVKASMMYLFQQFPAPVAFDDLLNHAHSMLNSEEVGQQDSGPETKSQIVLGEILLECFTRNMVELTLYPPPFTKKVSLYPCTTPLIRKQAEKGIVTNLQHKTTNLDTIARLVVQHLDGKHDHDSLLNILVNSVNSGNLVIRDKEGKPVQDNEKIYSTMKEQLNVSLSSCAQGALLLE